MNIKYKDIFNEYLHELKITGHTKSGIVTLRSGVLKLFQYLDDSDIPLIKVRVQEAQDYQGWLIETGRKDGAKYSDSSIFNYLVCASTFFNFLKKTKKVYTNPFQEIKRIRVSMKIPRNILKESQTNELLKEFRNYQDGTNLKQMITKYKLHVICELMYSTGLRINEVADLKIEDIDFMRGLVHVRDGKKGANRIALLNDYAKSVLKLYVEEMIPLILTEWHKERETLFGSGLANLGKLVNKGLKKNCLKLNLPVITSHSFRHAVGFHLLRNGCDIRYIQAILGHESLTTTEIYTKVEKEDLKEVLFKYHPRQFKRGQYENDNN